MQPEFFPYRYATPICPLPPSINTTSGHLTSFAVGFGFLHFAVTTRQHFAHSGVVVAGLGGCDVVAAVLRGWMFCSSYTTQDAIVASPCVWLISKHSRRLRPSESMPRILASSSIRCCWLLCCRRRCAIAICAFCSAIFNQTLRSPMVW